MNNKHIALFAALAVMAFESAPSMAEGDLTANAAVTNNYLWRGLTQTQNQAAVSGGIDYAAKGGFYIGTWVSNVDFGPAYPSWYYENDFYFGYSGGDKVKYDFGYIYYNYPDQDVNVDFGEVYGKFTVANFGASVYALTNTQIPEGPGQDLGAFSAFYVSLDYSVPLKNDLSIGLHAGHYSGKDFNAAFNGTPEYTDYNVSMAKGGFTFMISDTDLPAKQSDGYDNGSVKFVVSYKVDIDL